MDPSDVRLLSLTAEREDRREPTLWDFKWPESGELLRTG